MEREKHPIFPQAVKPCPTQSYPKANLIGGSLGVSFEEARTFLTTEGVIASGGAVDRRFGERDARNTLGPFSFFTLGNYNRQSP